MIGALGFNQSFTNWLGWTFGWLGSPAKVGTSGPQARETYDDLVIWMYRIRKHRPVIPTESIALIIANFYQR